MFLALNVTLPAPCWAQVFHVQYQRFLHSGVSISSAGTTANSFILAGPSPAAGRGQVLGWGKSRELGVLEAMH